MSLIVIVSGLPASGKTTIATHLARSANLILLSKDEIKEQLFDAIGINDRQWSRKIGRASVEILFRFARRALDADASVVMESTFRPDDCDLFHGFRRDFRCNLLQVHCTCASDELKRRFLDRAMSGDRHPGHVDDQNIAEFESQLNGPDQKSLALKCPLIEIDTTNPSRIDLDALAAAVDFAMSDR